MNKKTKKIIFLSGGFLLALILAGVAFFFFSGREGERRPSFPFFPETPAPGGGGGFSEGGGEFVPKGFSPLPRLFKITGTPVAGAVILADDEGNTERVRFMERATGKVFDYDVKTGDTKRVTNTTIPKVHEALWAPDGEKAIVRYLDDDNESIVTFSGRVVEGSVSAEGRMEGVFLPRNIREIAVSPDGKEVFYFSPENRKAGIMANFDGENAREVFSFPFSEWRVLWGEESGIALLTKPSRFVRGYVYSLDPVRGTLQKIFGGMLGLSARAGKDKMLLGGLVGGDILLFVEDAKTGDVDILPFSTPAEKCAAGSGAFVFCAVSESLPDGYPDEWYKGKVFFDDIIAAAFPGEEFVYVYADPEEEAGEKVDAVNLTLSEDENYLIFTNKRDGSLWGVYVGTDDVPISTPRE